MAKKQKKKRNKKYKPNYTTANRLDMRNGGRVGYQTGDVVRGNPFQKAFQKNQDEMSIERQDEFTPNLPPVQGNQPVLTGDMKDLTAGGQQGPALDKMPVDQQQRPDRSQMIFAGNTGNNFSENLTNASMKVRDVMDSRQGGPQADSNRFTVGQTRTLPNGTVLVWNGTSWVIQSGGGNTTTTNIPVDQMTDKQKQDLFESERGTRIIETGRTAQDIASGKLPDLPEAEVEKVSQEGTTADTVQMDVTTPAQASTIDQTAPEQVTDMTASTAATPAQIQAGQMEAATVGTPSQVDAAQGQVSRIAEAAGVDRVTPVEGAEVAIPEGALTDRVVGKLSDGQKATAAQNAGTSLARITRAKKQLTKAGLSQEDIQEIGNDPEALEARLEDFSEQERGIIAGLPEEALVSTQLNGLLEGMENGEIPPWARPAVTQVEQMLAVRGLTASSVGRDNLFNAIIQSAMPIAQSNAQAIQQSVSQQKSIEAQEAEANAQRRQQTALTNANNVFQMDMAQFNSDERIALSNSKFLQTVGLTEASNDQQAAIQNAVLMSQANLAEADFNQKAQIQNAQAFLQMDMANLSNEQQSNVLFAQQEQQRILSNQSAQNAARQFNAASENQTNQFMASLQANINQFNATQMTAASQFNAQSKNAAAARDANRVADVNKANAAILNQVSQFNAQLDFNREQWNSANEQAIINSNINWRRQSNLADTAAQNAVNQQNAQNAFGLTSSALSFLWQELRDQADYDFKWATDTANRKLNAMIAAASSEGDAAKNWSANFERASTTVDRIFGGT
jgi:hypothetical protein